MGGVMDLVFSKKIRVVVIMEYCIKIKQFKILKKCIMSLIGKRCVDFIIIEKAVFEVNYLKGLTLVELWEGSSVDDIKVIIVCLFVVFFNFKFMQQIKFDV